MDAADSKIRIIEQEVTKMKQSTKEDETEVTDCVEKVLTAQAPESAEEEVEKTKRITNVIVHSLAKSQTHEPAERVNDDLGLHVT